MTTPDPLASMSPDELLAVVPPPEKAGEPLVQVRLVPVEVFGADECDACGASGGYGLMDAVSAWSDCNRARGHIYRRDDLDQQHRDPADVITVYVPRSELPKFDQRFGED